MPDDNYYDSHEVRSIKFSHIIFEGIFEAARKNMTLFAYFNSPDTRRYLQDKVLRHAHGPEIDRLIQAPFIKGDIKIASSSRPNAPTILFKYEGHDSSLRDDEDPDTEAIIEIHIDGKTGRIIEITSEKIK